MDSIVVDLAARVVAVLLPLVSKGAEEFATKVGETTYAKAKTLLATLKHKWSQDKEASESLAHFEEKPERYKGVIEDILQEKLSQDNDLVAYISHLFQEMGPALEIIQKMDEGRDITGLKAEQMRRGTAKVTQDIKHGEKVTGAEFEKLG